MLGEEGFKVTLSSSKRNKVSRLLDMLVTVVRLRNQTDLVLIDTYSTQNFYYALFVSQLCRLLKLPYIPILHGGNLPKRLKNNPHWSKWVFKHAYTNVAPSLYLKVAFAAHGFNNLEFIPNTINIKEYPFTVREFNTPKLLWVRSFSKIYNPILAVEVFRKIKEKYPAAVLTMVGPNTDGTLGECEDLANCYDLPINFTGKLTKKEWVDLSKGYNIFINTTNVDNTPISVLEAMALGLPVVSTNVGGMPFLITDNEDGLLVPPQDVAAFVDAIELLMSDHSLQQRITINARKKVEHFDWSHIRHKWLELIENASKS